MERKNHKNKVYLLFGLIAFTMLATAYSIFTESLNITGSASANSDFDIEFTTATVQTQTYSTGATATIDVAKNILTLTAPSLEQPGAIVTYRVTVTNVGSIPARLNAVTATGDTTDPDVTLTLPTWDTVTVLNQNDTYQFDVTIEWDGASQTGTSISYNLELDYQQN